MSRPWTWRHQIPDSQIRAAADQYEAARQRLDKASQGTGVVLPLINTAAVAVELYLKSLSAERVSVAAGPPCGVYKIHADPEKGHILTKLLDAVRDDVRAPLEHAFADEHGSQLGPLREVLARIEGAFMASRYPFEAGIDVSQYRFNDLMVTSRFFANYVGRLEQREWIQ